MRPYDDDVIINYTSQIIIPLRSLRVVKATSLNSRLRVQLRKRRNIRKASATEEQIPAVRNKGKVEPDHTDQTLLLQVLFLVGIFWKKSCRYRIAIKRCPLYCVRFVFNAGS